jgi:thymidylate kinase
MAANILEVAEEAKKLTSEGFNVIIDRYMHSLIAYGMARGSSLEECKVMLDGAPAPDHIVYLDILPSLALTRKDPNKIEILENPEFQMKVYNNYKGLIEPHWIVVDGNQNETRIMQHIVDKLPL